MNLQTRVRDAYHKLMDSDSKLTPRDLVLWYAGIADACKAIVAEIDACRKAGEPCQACVLEHVERECKIIVDLIDHSPGEKWRIEKCLESQNPGTGKNGKLGTCKYPVSECDSPKVRRKPKGNSTN